MRAPLIFALLAACAQPRGEPLPIARGERDLVVHEWGTYTSLQGSDGRSMDGLHHAEHLLPGFVFARDLNPAYKGMASVPEPVNQKLETPVIYFYGEQSKRATVKVRFPEGIISEWYPNAIEQLDDFPRMAGGAMTWQVDLVDPSAHSFSPVKVEESSIWAPSRRVSSLGVRYAEQDERFIFYRGLGRFERPFTVRSTETEIIVLNGSADTIPAAFLLSVTEDGGSIVELGRIEPSTPIQTSPGVHLPGARYLADAKLKVERALIDTGLYDDEARAMVDTWEQSYFTSPGTRVLYIAPRAWTDALLPIEIAPEPRELVRTLVGRVEVMTVAEERSIVADVTAAVTARGTTISADSYGRFTEPKLRRALELIEDPEVAAWCRAFVDTFAALP